MLRSLVGSEMCIRDRYLVFHSCFEDSLNTNLGRYNDNILRKPRGAIGKKEKKSERKKVNRKKKKKIAKKKESTKTEKAKSLYAKEVSV